MKISVSLEHHLFTNISADFVSTSSIFDTIKSSTDLGKKAKARAIVEMHDMVSKIAESTGTGKKQIAQALTEPNTLGFLKAFGYSVKTAYKCLSAAGNAVHNGVLAAMETALETPFGKKLQNGAVTADAFLERHPVIKKMTGPVIAGLLAYQWLNMSYIGEGDLDFDVGYIGEALAGNYSVADVISSPDGLSNMAYVASLTLTGGALSFPYLIKDSIGITIAVAYSAVKHSDRIPGVTKLKASLKRRLSNYDLNHWWARLSKRGKQKYLKEHPGSSYSIS